MQISKLKLGVLAALVCASVSGVQADQDTPAQAAARAALYQRMQQADGITNPPASTAPMAAPEQNSTPPAPTTPAAPTSPMVDANDTPAQAVARAALLKRMQDADAAGGQPILVNPNGAVPPENTMTPAQLKAIEGATAKANADKAAAEQAEADKKAADQQAADTAKAKQAQDAQAAAMAASYPGKEMGFQPPSVPPSPISAEKQAKLDDLLIQYKADQISPEEYHRQRAAILAEP